MQNGFPPRAPDPPGPPPRGAGVEVAEAAALFNVRRPYAGALRCPHGLPATADGIFFLPQPGHAPPSVEAALCWLEPLVLPGVCVAITPRRPRSSSALDDLARLLARTRLDARGWLVAPSHVRGGLAPESGTVSAAVARGARAMIPAARVLVLDEGGPASVARLTMCRTLLLGCGAREVTLLALARPAGGERP